MKIDHIIVQAGGKGTRLEYLTENKPKALVPVDNLPMLFHLFRRYPDKKYVVIADYKGDVLRGYLEAFADVKYQIVCADGAGTCGGISQAAVLLPEGTPFMLLWSDLILPEAFTLPVEDGNYAGLSQTFPCRWKYENGLFDCEESVQNGVAGLFVFKDKSAIANVPRSGELVRFFKESGMRFTPLGLAGTREIGTLAEYEKCEVSKTRPFNKLIFRENKVIKEPLDEQGRRLAERETAWYDYAQKRGVSAVPRLCGTSPLTMELIDGKNIYDCEPSPMLLEKIICALKELHEIAQIPTDSFSLREAYYNKTMRRLEKIRNLVPLADRKTIVVNGRECRNVFFYRHEFEKLVEKIPADDFVFIHGDCTFSNIMLRGNDEPVLIDPRGYFGYTELYGSADYDWAKLYYSMVGNYDQFNLKNFRLEISDDIRLEIKSNGWEALENDFFRLSGTDKRTIKLLHAAIWLSLTTYAWQDYDSICGAFYNGIYYLEEVL